MSAMPVKGKRPTKDERRKRLYALWMELVQALDGFTCLQAERLFQSLRQAVVGTIIHEASCHARLGEHDERMYEYYARIITAYRETVSLYEQNRNVFETFAVKSILEGIYAVLVSRIAPFEDAANGTAGGGQNPITAEKTALYDKASGYFAGNADSQTRYFAEHRLSSDSACMLSCRQALLEAAGNGPVPAVTNILWESASEFSFRGLYAFYRDGLKIAHTGLNDLNQRKITQYYYDLMESEMEILGSIIKIQVQALEFALEHSPVTSREKGLVSRILTLLREGYQHLGRAAIDIKKVFNDAETAAQPVIFQTYEEFTMSLNALFKDAQAEITLSPSAEVSKHKSAFLEALAIETDAMFEKAKRGFFKAIYRFQRIFSEEVLLADEMTAAFERLSRLWPSWDNPPEGMDTSLEILRGVAETIEIKIESLRDSVFSLNADGVRMINEFANGKREITQVESVRTRSRVAEQWIAVWAGIPYPSVKSASGERPDTAAMKSFFEECFKMDIFSEMRQYYEKRETDYAEKINRTILRFKKEILLYEVSTYEEILIYSVSRLREIEWEPVRASVELLDETMMALEMLLKKNGITVIKPEPHEPFNGREHEVLMAEPQDGFKKGEIVKLINSGYRQKDAVILRANVIAAR